MDLPRNEAPILVEYLHQGDHHHYDRSDRSAAERRPLVAEEVWLEADQIPETPPAQSAYPGTMVGVVCGVSGVVLTAVAGDPLRFESTLDHFMNMIPANYADGAYEPTLRDSSGAVVPYDPSVWVADGVRRVVEFKYGPPGAGLQPFTIDYWKYAGDFPTAGGGGGGGVSGGQNLGAGREVFKDVSATVMRFRTITAGPGLSDGQDDPVVDEIMVSADEVTPAGAPAVPASLDLHVSESAGDDVGGDGTLGAPYKTLERAFRDIRVLGYDDAASVTILETGSPLLVSEGLLALGQGSRGRRATPVEIKGSARTTPHVGLVVTGVTPNPETGFVDISVAPVMPAGTIRPGQIVRFTSGGLLADGVTPIECFVASGVGPSGFRIPVAGATVGIGDVFDVDELTSVLSVNGVVGVWSKDSIHLRDVIVEMSGDVGALAFIDTPVVATGVWLKNLTTVSGILGNMGGRFQSGGTMPDVNTVTAPTSLGMYIDNESGAEFIRDAFDPAFGAGPAEFSNCVFRGSGVAGNLTVGGPLRAVVQCYFEAAGSLRSAELEAKLSNLWFRNSAPALGGGALEVGGAHASVASIRVAGSTAHGLRVFNGGTATLAAGEFNIGGCAAAGILGELGGHVIKNVPVASLTFGAGNAGPGVQVSDHGRFTDHGAGGLAATAASTATHGVMVVRSSSLHVDEGLECRDTAAGAGLFVADGSSVVVGGALICVENGEEGVRVESSRLSANTLASNNNQQVGGKIFPNSASVAILSGSLTVASDVTVVSTVGFGFLAQGATVRIGSVLGATAANFGGNGGSGGDVGFAVSECRVVFTNVIAVSSAALAGSGIVISGSYVNFTGLGQPSSLTCNGNTAIGIVVRDSELTTSGESAVVASNNGVDGMLVDGGSDVAVSSLTAEGNGDRGVVVVQSKLSVSNGFLTATNDKMNLLTRRSKVIGGGMFTASESVTEGGIWMSNSELAWDTETSFTCDTNANDGIYLSQSTLRLRGGTPVSASSNTGYGVFCTGSVINVAEEESPGPVTIANNGTGGLLSPDSGVASTIGFPDLNLLNNSVFGARISATRMVLSNDLTVTTSGGVAVGITVENASHVFVARNTTITMTGAPAHALRVEMGSDFTATGNISIPGVAGVNAVNPIMLLTSSTLAVTSPVAVADSGGDSIIVDNSTLRLTKSGIFSIANSGGRGLVVRKGATVVVETTVSASNVTSTAGNGVDVSNSKLTVGATLVIQNTSGVGLLAVNSDIAVHTATASSCTGSFQLQGSTMHTTVMGSQESVGSYGVQLTSSTLTFPAAGASFTSDQTNNLISYGLKMDAGSTATLRGVISIMGQYSFNSILVDEHSDLIILSGSMATSFIGTSFPTTSMVVVGFGSKLTMRNITFVPSIGGELANYLVVTKGSRANLINLTNNDPTGLALGLLVEYNSNVEYVAGSIAMVASDCKVGANAAVTWAVMDGGLAADVSDHSPPNAHAAPQMCRVVPFP